MFGKITFVIFPLLIIVKTINKKLSDLIDQNKGVKLNSQEFTDQIDNIKFK